MDPASTLSLWPHPLQLALLEDAITELRKFEGELQVKASHLASMRLDASQPSSFLSLKGKRQRQRLRTFNLLSTLASSPIPIPTSSSFPLSHSDKSEGDQFSLEFDEASQRLQDYCECLGIEVNERINLLNMLKGCRAHYTQLLSELLQAAKVGPLH